MRLTRLFGKCTMAVLIMALLMPLWGCGKEEITPVSGNTAKQESSLANESETKEEKSDEEHSETKSKDATKEETQAQTQDETQDTTEAETQETTQEPVETQTQTEIQVPTQAPTEPPTEAPVQTEAPTETQAATEPSTEPTTQSGPGKLEAPFDIAFLGDSITVGYGSSYSYADVVCENLKANKYNYGYSGDTLACDDRNGFLKRYTSIFEGSEVIVVYGGSNDYYRNIPLGSPDSRRDDEFYGALKQLCKGLKEKYTKSHIVFITPLRGEFAGKYNSGNNETGSSMWDYVDAMKKVCAQHGIHVIDIYNNFIIDGDNYDEYTTDGLHPNEKGHDAIAAELEKYIRSLM